MLMHLVVPLPAACLSKLFERTEDETGYIYLGIIKTTKSFGRLLAEGLSL